MPRLVRYTRQFNEVDLTGDPCRQRPGDRQRGEITSSRASRTPSGSASRTCARYHEKQLPGPMTFGEILPGVYAG